MSHLISAGLGYRSRRNHGDKQHVMLDRVNDAAVADANARSRSTAERFRARRPRILAEEGYHAANAIPILVVDLP